MNANTEIQKEKTKNDKLTWIGVFALLILAIVGNYYFSKQDIMPVLRIIGVALVIIIAFVLAALTYKGKATLKFIKEARTEMRKVVWPTRKETMQTTLIVAVITAITSIVLWLLDSVMLEIVYYVTKLGH